MAIKIYDPAPLQVDISDLVVNGQVVAKRRARRYLLQLPDTPAWPCLLSVEITLYLALPDGGYGPELTANGIVRKVLGPFAVEDTRLVDDDTGRILASRADLNDTQWAAAEKRLQEDDTVVAAYQGQWFRHKMREELVNVDGFIEQYILMLDASGDLG